jgi:hypothetical protein
LENPFFSFLYHYYHLYPKSVSALLSYTFHTHFFILIILPRQFEKRRRTEQKKLKKKESRLRYQQLKRLACGEEIGESSYSTLGQVSFLDCFLAFDLVNKLTGLPFLFEG